MIVLLYISILVYIDYLPKENRRVGDTIGEGVDSLRSIFGDAGCPLMIRRTSSCSDLYVSLCPHTAEL